MGRLILTGDVNLMNVTDPTVPFRRVADEFRAASMVFSNLDAACTRRPPRNHFITRDFTPIPPSAPRPCAWPQSAPSVSPTT